MHILVTIVGLLILISKAGLSVDTVKEGQYTLVGTDKPFLVVQDKDGTAIYPVRLDEKMARSYRDAMIGAKHPARLSTPEPARLRDSGKLDALISVQTVDGIWREQGMVAIEPPVQPQQATGTSGFILVHTDEAHYLVSVKPDAHIWLVHGLSHLPSGSILTLPEPNLAIKQHHFHMFQTSDNATHHVYIRQTIR